MSNNKVKNSIADNARREIKLLNKPTKLTLDPFGKTDVELKQPFPKELGEYAVVVIATPMTTIQFTIAHPVGVTDLDGASWVAHRSDQLQGLLARSKDPNQTAIDQSRTVERQQLAVRSGLLIEKKQDGKRVFFYPHRSDVERNRLLDMARAQSKKASSDIKAQIDALTDENKREKQGLMIKLQHAADFIEFLDEPTAMAEKELKKFYLSPQVEKEVLEKHPQLYRTLAGPYFTIPQVAIPESDGKRLEDVAVQFARSVAIGTAVPPRHVQHGGGKDDPPFKVEPKKEKGKTIYPEDYLEEDSIESDVGKVFDDDDPTPKPPRSGGKGVSDFVAKIRGKG